MTDWKDWSARVTRSSCVYWRCIVVTIVRSCSRTFAEGLIKDSSSTASISISSLSSRRSKISSGSGASVSYASLPTVSPSSADDGDELWMPLFMLEAVL